jgi:hypothetical protein
MTKLSCFAYEMHDFALLFFYLFKEVPFWLNRRLSSSSSRSNKKAA